MSGQRQASKVDPVLQRMLDRRGAASSPVEAVFTLRTAKSAKPAPSPTHVEATVRRLLRRVEARVGVAPVAVNVFRNLGAFAVVAPPRFVRALAAQAEVTSATANRQPESMFVPPRSKRPCRRGS